ncbi:hypothetical protein BV898_15201 [Hypsibius exemplaris]|uniref:Nerve growth factor-related domain-containing protein n=1 Tax=Hypsibius exemplaris TaxID=2072580 RepID=A0A9X6RK99_HYPEX|nr:hypothetical protein BV898_15201 [Hypsibius exemplaris]
MRRCFIKAVWWAMLCLCHYSSSSVMPSTTPSQFAVGEVVKLPVSNHGTHSHPHPHPHPSRTTVRYPVTPVCRSVDQWSTPSNPTQDVFGNLVRVLPDFRQNNATVSQLIHERFCSEEPPPAKLLPLIPGSTTFQGSLKCQGLGEPHTSGRCRTRHAFVYAYVRNSRGEDGWHVVRVRGGCECELFASVAEEIVHRAGR